MVYDSSLVYGSYLKLPFCLFCRGALDCFLGPYSFFSFPMGCFFLCHFTLSFPKPKQAMPFLPESRLLPAQSMPHALCCLCFYRFHQPLAMGALFSALSLHSSKIHCQS